MGDKCSVDAMAFVRSRVEHFGSPSTALFTYDHISLVQKLAEIPLSPMRRRAKRPWWVVQMRKVLRRPGI